jgi:hypothetical protein
LPISEVIVRKEFSDTYKNDLFLIWYNGKQPAAKRLWEMIPESWNGAPVVDTVRIWIKDIFRPRAEDLDKRLAREIEGRLIQEKVEMLYRHAELGRKIQRKALDCLDQIDPEDLSSNAAVRLLVEGVRIERDSVGLPQALEKILNASDEEMLNRVQELTKESQAEILVDDYESS